METISGDNQKKDARGYTFVLDSPYIMTGREYYDRFTAGRKDTSTDRQPDRESMLGSRDVGAYSGVPEKIREMLDLFEYGDGSFIQKCQVFCRQGMLMKDYEDTALWYGDLRLSFPVYHDLNIRQLRGYFAWRTQVRKGMFRKTCEAFACIYIYELLNGIGAGSAEESFDKLEEFYRGYVETGMGDPLIRMNLRRWLRDFAIISGFPKEAAERYDDSGSEARDRAITVLHDPERFSDEEVFGALTRFSSPGIKTSPVISKDPVKGKRLFAEVWRHLQESAFVRCFGEPKAMPWHPFAGAIYLERRGADCMDYAVSDCRHYTLSGGVWQETGYSRLSADQEAFLQLCHMTDLKLRRLLKTGRYLRQKQGEEWAEQLVQSALDDMQREAAEAARPKITIDLSGLYKIREDADITCDSLLTESETGNAELSETAAESLIDTGSAAGSKCEHAPAAGLSPDCSSEQHLPEGLDPVQISILRELLAGRSAEALISENRLMPEVVADSINEALIDEIGDSVIECTDGSLTIVDDYTDDLITLTGGCR